EDEDEIETESKQIKPSFAKVKSVKSTEHVKSPRKFVKQEESNRQTKYLRKTSQSPRDHLGKFKGKADEGFLVGYSVNNDKDVDEVPGKGDEGVSKISEINDLERTDSSTQDVNTAGPSINTANININTEPKKVIQALTDPSWIEAMQKELLQFKHQK
nr:hypothetical protein [Tanacetum cinerariifolium]